MCYYFFKNKKQNDMSKKKILDDILSTMISLVTKPEISKKNRKTERNKKILEDYLLKNEPLSHLAIKYDISTATITKIVSKAVLSFKRLVPLYTVFFEENKTLNLFKENRKKKAFVGIDISKQARNQLISSGIYSAEEFLSFSKQDLYKMGFSLYLVKKIKRAIRLFYEEKFN